MTDRTPTTAAGRALLDEYPGVWFWEDPRWNGPLGEAIEADARAPLDVERLAQDDNAGGVWVHHTPSKPVRLAGYPALGGSFCRMCGGDWPCANVREYATEVQP